MAAGYSPSSILARSLENVMKISLPALGNSDPGFVSLQEYVRV